MSEWKPKITRYEFEEAFLQGSQMSLTEYRLHRTTLPCACGYAGCEGWAAVRPTALIHHLCYCFPSKKDLMAYDCSDVETREFEQELQGRHSKGP